MHDYNRLPNETYQAPKETRICYVVMILVGCFMVPLVLLAGYQTLDAMQQVVAYNKMMTTNTYLMCNMTSKLTFSNVVCVR